MLKLIKTIIFFVGLAVIIYTVMQFNSDLIDTPLDITKEVANVDIENQRVHRIKITEDGFEPEELTINVGDKVIWQNVRDGRLKKALVLGSRQCINIKSNSLETGDTFEWTFNQAEKCIFVDAITKYQTGEVNVK
jgi:plastocyanin